MNFGAYRNPPGFGAYGHGVTPAVKKLLILNIAAFFLQSLLDRSLGGWFSYTFALSLDGLSKGHLWQLVTYQFLHGGAFHLLVNMMLLFFLGPEMERTMGTRHFLVLYFLSGVLAGTGWVLIEGVSTQPCVGASGSLYGVLAGFATFFPNRLMTVFPLMITMRAWVMVSLFILIDMLFLVGGSGRSIAHSAHLAGALTGYVYICLVFTPERAGWASSLRRFVENRRAPVAREQRPGNWPERSIDEILDKISRDGLQSLTPEERRTLQEHSRRR